MYDTVPVPIPLPYEKSQELIFFILENTLSDPLSTSTGTGTSFW
jgi:hypothetical protein